MLSLCRIRRFRFSLIVLAILTLLQINTAGQAVAEIIRRHAFVVGVGDYKELAPLRTATADAEDVSNALERLPTTKYNVRPLINPKLAKFEQAWHAFLNDVKPGDLVVFYFAGHGIEAQQSNFLLLSDAKKTDMPNKDSGYYPLQQIIDELSSKHAIPILILDACRDDPLSAGHSLGGLAGVTPPTGGAVLFSAGARQKALDTLRYQGNDRNGLFTASLLAFLGRTDLTVETLAGEVKNRVWPIAKAAGRLQSPAFWGDLPPNICLAGPCTLKSETVSPEVAAHDCDLVAAHPEDPRHGKPGVYYEELDASLVLLKCQPAVDLNPGNSRLIFQLGRGYDRLREFREAHKRFKQAAEMGDAAGMAALALQYRDAFGTPRNHALAKSLLEKAADAGNVHAMRQLGVLHETGAAGTIDVEKAFQLYERARDGGSVPALVNIGNAYEIGRGIEKDPHKAFDNWKAAADRGSPHGLANVGWAYAAGIGVDKQDSQAVAALEAAEARGILSAVRNIGWLHEEGRTGPIDRSEARREAFRRYKFVYDDGRDADEKAIAAVAIGTFHENGWLFESNPSEAAKLYREAIDVANNARAHWNLAVMYQNKKIGRGNAEDYMTALEHIRSAIELGEQRARLTLGWAYHHGLGVEPDRERARKEYEIAAEHGDSTALNNLGSLILEETDDAERLQQARQYFEKAYSKKSSYGAYNLGRLYLNGVAVERNLEQAVVFLLEARDWGHPTVLHNLCWYTLTVPEVQAFEPRDKTWCAQFAETPRSEVDAAYIQGLLALQNGRKADARQRFVDAAELGLADAKCDLSSLLDEEARTSADVAEAVDFFLDCARREWLYTIRLRLGYTERFVRGLQGRLRDYDLYKGRIDGIVGRGTVDAVYAWRKRGLSQRNTTRIGR